jgi:prephenate dehydrogenase
MPQNIIQIGILGLGRIGTSVGLGLKRHNARKEAKQAFHIVGYDKRESAIEVANKRKAIDSVTRSAFDAAHNKDVVLIALPYAQVKDTYHAIAGALRSGCVVLDASPLKLPSLEWAKKTITNDAHAIGVTPIINPTYLYDGLDDTEHAAEDLFDKGGLLLMPSATAHPDAVELASDFGTILGATPHFVDPIEHDGVVAATEGIPALLGIAMFSMLRQSAGWGDAQRTGNPALGLLTHHLNDTHPDDIRDLLLNNVGNTLRYLDELIETLNAYRAVLAARDQAALEAELITTLEHYQAWLTKRNNGDWDKQLETPNSSSGNLLMSGFLGGFLTRKLRGENDKDK